METHIPCVPQGMLSPVVVPQGCRCCQICGFAAGLHTYYMVHTETQTNLVDDPIPNLICDCEVPIFVFDPTKLESLPVCEISARGSGKVFPQAIIHYLIIK